MGVVITMLPKSLEPGRYPQTYQQFKTIQKLHAGFSNCHMTSVEGVLSLCTVEGDRAKHHLMYSPTQSLWFEHFAQGYLKQMGQDVRKDWAITLRAMHGLMDVLEQEWADPIDEGHRELVASIEAYWVIAFCGSFCGPKVFTTGLHGL